MRSNQSLSLLAAALISFATTSALAAEGYITDTRGVVVKNPFGQCWRTGTWTPANAIAECDPDLVAPAPVAAPAPAAAPVEAPAKVIEAVKAVEVPAPKAIELPKPVEKLVAAATAPKFEKITLEAEGLFDFGKKDLKPEGKAQLDKLAEQLKRPELKDTKITITGHTDRIGNPEGNRKASLARAEAAKAQLVAKGVPAENISTEGKGSSESITKDTCNNIKQRAKLIECLQPDRRIEIDATASRQVK